MKYQDLVIKDGEFIGDFETLYENFDDPWDQSTRELYSNEKLIGLEIIKSNNYKNVIELGCGIGYYSNRIKSVSEKCTGVDISDLAIKKAKKLHPDCEFIQSDILNSEIYKEKDFIMMVEITWYVLPKLKKFKDIIKTMSGVGFFHTLNMYTGDQQKYGNEYFTNNEEILDFFSDIIDIKEYGIFNKKEYNGCYRTYFYGIIK